MGFWNAVVIIVAIVVFANMRRHRHLSGGDIARQPFAQPDSGYTRELANRDLEREVVDLRKRLEVLERIVTDERETKRLAHEIESLRDR
ncbi:hypothetical protein [Novosphingobium lentum]|uniref:hypothetical protein n=1 Tax=Novosphingobium lentum TaxID=145287 RepID=UPI00082B0D5E|nr:hypothetical protein [Novosphingobium lentum]